MHRKFLTLASGLMTLSGLALAVPEPFARPDLKPEPEKRELNTEYVRGDEPRDLKIVIDSVKARWSQLNLPLPEGERLRDAHAHAHGCVKATFEVEKNLDPSFRTGAFSFLNDQAPVYNAWIRFSNGNDNPKKQPDWVPDGRGMAIKLTKIHSKLPATLKNQRQLTDVEEEVDTQDFLMIHGADAFFIDDLASYQEFFTKGPAFFADPKHAIERQRLGAMSGSFLSSPLAGHYFSAVPSRLAEPAGPQGKAFKFSARPCAGQTLKKLDGLEDLEALYKTPEFLMQPKKFADRMKPEWANYLKTALIKQNEESDACFEFVVQLQGDADKHRIEHSTDRWDTPYTKVATIRIPKQQAIDAKARANFCEALSYSPWNGVHRPLSAVGWARRFVYPIISDARHPQAAGTRRDREPTGEENI